MRCMEYATPNLATPYFTNILHDKHKENKVQQYLPFNLRIFKKI